MMDRVYQTKQPFRPFSKSDVFVLLVMIAFLYLGVHLGLRAPKAVAGPEILLAPRWLPYYALRSVGRMAAAYLLSLVFALCYGYAAAYNRRAEQLLMPLLDVLQSVPILSFLPVALLSLSALVPQGLAAELTSIILIFTSQAWNMTFSWYQSLTTIPGELREASHVFRFNGWMRLRTLELPFGLPGLLWNSMMSWAGGWFFLMAAETFTVGQHDFRLPGLGSYLREAANLGDVRAIFWGLGTLVAVIILLDQLLWRPLVAWSERFTLEMVERDFPATSWFYNLLRSSALLGRVSHGFSLLGEHLDAWMLKLWPYRSEGVPAAGVGRRRYLGMALRIALILVVAYGVLRAVGLLRTVPIAQWGQIGLGVLMTTLRVVLALIITLVWTIPVGVAIGLNPRLSSWLQPVAQIVASIPATALFPVFVLALAGLPGGLSLAVELLMLTGAQWYVLFNVIAGAATIPQDLRYTTSLLGLSQWERWRTLILPALFPYVVTGAITASGGAWNASIVAEYIEFGGQTLRVKGIGDLISFATVQGDYPMLLAATLTMVVTVVLINRFFWRKLYRLAEERYRME